MTSALERIAGGTTVAEGLAVFDALPAVPVEEMLGSWRGEEVPTGNPLDGALARSGWHGKRFDGPDDVHPLVMDGGRFAIDPAALPLEFLVRHPRLLRVPLPVRRLVPLLRTTRPKARLRLLEYRGVVSATMIYDALPVHDAFRRVDDDAVLGAMDLRGLADPFLFVLRRES